MQIPKKTLIGGTVFLFLLVPMVLNGCARNTVPISKTGLYFDTVITITIYDEQKESCLEECFALAEKYEKLLSPSLEGSDIWNINHSKGKPVEVSEETIYLLQTALAYCELTDGLIDPTIDGVSKLWDFQSGEHEPPASDAIAEAVRHVDYHAIVIENNTVSLTDPEASVSLGFIAKGYIADKMKEYLLTQNIESAIINLGGNLLAIGLKPDHTPFQFGIQKPFDEQGTPITTLSITDKSVVSSGVYERFFYHEDNLYHHILNPKTGYPVQNELLGVTIISDSSMTGDALSTTCFVLGLEKGMQLMETLEDTEAVFITADYQLYYTKGMESYQ